MKRTVQSFFSGLADRFTSGDLQGIARHFIFPAAVYYRDEIMVFENAEEMARAHQLYRRSLSDAGYARTDCKVVAQSLTRADRKSVWVQWSHYQSGQRLMGQSFVRFFVCHHAGLPVRIMLAEYLQVPDQAQPRDLPLRPRNRTAG